MRRLGQDAEVLFRQLGIGHGQEALFDCLLAGDIAEPGDGRFTRLTFVFARTIKRLQVGTQQDQEENCSRNRFHEAPV